MAISGSRTARTEEILRLACYRGRGQYAPAVDPLPLPHAHMTHAFRAISPQKDVRANNISRLNISSDSTRRPDTAHRSRKDP